jgi:hypothetical protein
MKSRPFTLPATVLLACVLALAGCGDDQDPDGAADLWKRIHDQNYRSWMRAPGYETRKASAAAHGDEVDIYVNPAIQAALSGAGPLASWPDGSVIVKDGFSGGDPHIVAAMEKAGSTWFWAEWDPDGQAAYSGNPSICTDCHQSGADMVRAFGFPP